MNERDSPPKARPSAIDPAVVSDIADRADVSADDLSDALVVLDAELLGLHSTYEAEGRGYVTVDGTRAYRVAPDAWDDLLAEFDFDFAAGVGDAVRRAHGEQARRMYEAADEDDTFDDGAFGDDDGGIVVGMDTAERMG